MTAAKSATLVLEQMLEAARKAMSFIEGYGEQDFLADARTQAAVSMHLIVIGEMANRLARDAAIAGSARELPLRQMQGMRNRIAHGYHELDMAVVWDTAFHVLPDFALTLSTLIDEVRGNSAAPSSPSECDP